MKKIRRPVTALVLTFVLLLPQTLAVPAQAAGNTITSVEGLRAIEQNPSGSYELGCDLDLGGYNGGWWKNFNFSGTLEGNGHTISGLQMNGEWDDSCGLFDQLSGRCTISNLNLVLGEQGLVSRRNAGGIAADYSQVNGGSLTLSNCSVKGTIKGGSDYGDEGTLVGKVYAYSNFQLTVTACRGEGTVTALSDMGSAGGLIGSAQGGTAAITGCTFSGTVLSPVTAAGIVAELSEGAAVDGCVVDGTVTALYCGTDSLDNVVAGGVLAYRKTGTEVKNCTVNAAVSAQSPGNGTIAQAGGLVGCDNEYQDATAIVGGTTTGAVTASGTQNAYAGGIGGAADYIDCTAKGTVVAAAENGSAVAGGIDIYGATEGTASYTDCACYGAVSAESQAQDAYAGGIVAVVFQGALTRCNSYGDVTARSGSETEDSFGAEAAGIAGGGSETLQLSDCHAAGAVSAQAPKGGYVCAGGVGWTWDCTARLINCSAGGPVSVTMKSGFSFSGIAGLLQRADGIFDSCAFTGTVKVSWSGEERDYPCYAFSDSTKTTLTGTRYNTSGLDLYPADTHEDSNPTLPEGTAVVAGSHANVDYAGKAEAYYNQGDTYFRVLVRGEGYPQTGGFTLTIGGKQYNTGSGNDLYVDIPEDDTGDVTVSKEGFASYTLPHDMMDKYNWIMLWRETADTKPIIQSVLRKKDGSVGNYLLSTNADSPNVGDAARWNLLVQVDWQGRTPGTVWLQQGSRRVNVMTDGFTGGFAPGLVFRDDGGTIYVCAQNADGETTKVSTTLKVLHKPVQLDPGVDPVEVTAPDTVQFLSNATISLDLFGGSLPVELEINQDGTFRGTIGAQMKETAYKKQAFGNIKNLVSIIKTEGVGADIDAAAEQLLQEENAVLLSRSASFGVKGKVQFLGYLEGYVAQEGDGKLRLVTTDGGMLLKGQASATVTKQFYAVYGQASLSDTLQLNFPWDENGPALNNINNKIAVKIGGGIGVADILSVGVSGTGNLVAAFDLPEIEKTWDLYASYELAVGEISALDFSFTIHTYKSDKYYWVKDGNAAFGESEPQSLSAQSIEDGTLRRMDRDYLENARFTANDPVLEAQEESNAVTTREVKTGLFPNTSVQMVTLPDGLLAVWVDDAGSAARPLAANRTALYYSQYSDGSWSEPALVEDDGTADYAPRLRVLDNKAYLVWMNAGEVFSSDGVTLQQEAAAMDIRAACFTGSGFADVAAVSAIAGQPACLDMLPDVALVSRQPAVVWLRESANDLENKTAAGSLCCAMYNGGGWGSPEVMAEGLSEVDSLTAGNEYDNLCVWYSAGSDEDSSTSEDKEIWSVTRASAGSFSSKQVTENDVPDTKPVYENGLLTYYSDGTLLSGGETVRLSSTTDRFRFVSGQGRNALLYTEADEGGGTALYALFNDGSGWGSPVYVTGADLRIPSFDGCFDSEGRLQVMSAATDSKEIAQDGAVTTATRLQYSTLAPNCDVAVTKTDYQVQSLTNGGTLSYFVTVENRGAASASYLQVTVLNGDTELGRTVFAESLAAGASKTLCGECPLPVGFGDTALTVRAEPLNGTDADESNNTATLTLSRKDLSVRSVTSQRFADGRTLVTALVTNCGLDGVEDAAVALQTKPEETSLESQAVTLAAGKSATVQFITDRLSEEELFYITAAVQNGERAVADNQFLARVLAAADYKLSLEGTAAYRSDDGVTVSLKLENTTETAQSGSLVTALYRDGRLLKFSMRTAEVDAQDTYIGQETFRTTETGPMTVQVFYLDSTGMTPLTSSTSLSVQ